MIPLSTPEADHENEAEAVLRELEEEIAREAAEGNDPQVSDNPQPEPEVDVKPPPPTLPRGWHSTDTDPADEEPGPSAEPEEDVPAADHETDEAPAVPADQQPTEPAAQPEEDIPAPPTLPSGWQPEGRDEADDEVPAAPSPPSGWRPAEDVPAADLETTDETSRDAAAEIPVERPTMPSGWVTDKPLPTADDSERAYDVAGEVPGEDPLPLPPPPSPPPAPSAPSAPLIVPPAQRGVPPLPPPPSVPTGWLMDEEAEAPDEATEPAHAAPTAPAAPVYGPATPTETPASYLHGAYSSPGMTATPSAPPVGLPRVQMPQPPWWRKQSTMIGGAAIVLVVLLGVFAFIVLREDSPTLTYNGQDIEDAAGTLTSAERTVANIVDERHGASNDDTRCYFSLKDAAGTDVADHLRCGPVLFIDGEEDQPYLTFALTRGDAEGDAVRLVAADQPDTPEPSKLEAGEELRRPDDASPPASNGGLEVPPPPRADPGVFEANPLEGVELEDPGGDAEIVSYGTSYHMTGFADPDRYGQGDAARRPARGEKFVAVQFDVGLGEFPMVADSPTLAVQIGDEAPVPLPGDPEVTLDSMILSVPEDTDVVDLVVTEQGIEQRLSLLDGAPGANNIAVLRRDTLDHITAASADLSFSASRPGFVTETFSVNVGIPAARLFWFFGDGGVQHPSGPNRAWLVPETTHAWGPGLGAGPDVSLDPEFFKLALPDGTVVNASNLATDGRILVAFDVPADFSQGTLTVGGVVTRFNGETWDFGASTLSVPINIPAG